MTFSKVMKALVGKGPIAKNIDIKMQKKLISDLNIKEGDAVFLFVMK